MGLSKLRAGRARLRASQGQRYPKHRTAVGGNSAAPTGRMVAIAVPGRSSLSDRQGGPPTGIGKQTLSGMCRSDSPLVMLHQRAKLVSACLLSHSTVSGVQHNGGYPTCTSWHPAKVFSPIAVCTPPAGVAITPRHASCGELRWAKTRASMPASAAPSLRSLAASRASVASSLGTNGTSPVPAPRPQSGVPCPQDEVLSLRP